MSNNVHILWADDEIEILRPQIIFLKAKGYEVITVSNGYDAIEKCREEKPDIVFLDESMPGITGLDTLAKIKEIDSNVPVVMITKNEEENIMESAIGAQIADYLIKPVNPNQILLTLKKIIDNKRLVNAATTSAYQQEFSRIISSIQMGPDHHEWKDIYKKLIYWELEFDQTKSRDMHDVLSYQKTEANNEFFKYINRNYQNWMSGTKDSPLMSHNLLKEKVFSKITAARPTVFILIDNLRYDQYKVIQPIISQFYKNTDEDIYYSILPTATQYCRNAIFAGLTPYDIEKKYPQYWVTDVEEGGKNLFEQELLAEHLKRLGKDYKMSYRKITNLTNGKALVDNAHNLLDFDLSVVVYNFVDMLSHARTEMEVIKELASDERAYRSLTASWFEHSPLWQFMQRIAEKDVQIIISTDHGTVKVSNPVKVVGDRYTTTNLRYKSGRALNFDAKEVYEIRKPEEGKLPKTNISTSYIFARPNDFFAYPNNYNYYVNYYKDTFQHGGISLEEILIPIVGFLSK